MSRPCFIAAMDRSLNDILPGLELTDVGLEFKESAFGCCMGSGNRIEGNCATNCGLKKRVSKAVGVLQAFHRATGLTCKEILPVDRKQVRQGYLHLLANSGNDRALRPGAPGQSARGQALISDAKSSCSSIWAMALVDAWHFGKDVMPFQIGKTFQNSRSQDAYYVVADQARWSAPQIEELDWLICRAYAENRPLWISFCHRKTQASTLVAKSFGERIARAKSPLSFLSASTRSKFKEICIGDLPGLKTSEKAKKKQKSAFNLDQIP